MLSDRERNALADILENIALAETFLSDTGKRQFGIDKFQFYAVTRALEIISEASRRLPPTVRNRYPEILWQQIADAGNVYRHGYDVVSPPVVWETVKSYLPALRGIIEGEIRSNE